MKRILVTGDRDWTDVETIRSALLIHYQPGDVLMHGCCRGADRIADRIAKEMGWAVDPHPANWYDERGKLRLWAGPERNRKMLKLLDPATDVVLAFHPDINASKGTKDMVTIALAANVRVVLHDDQKRVQIFGQAGTQVDLPFMVRSVQ